MSNSKEMKNRSLAWLIKLSVSALLLGWVLQRARMDEILRIISTVNVGLYLLAVGLVFASYLLSSYKWQRLLIALNVKERCIHLCALNLISLFYSLILPGQLFGEAVKAYRIARGKQEKSKLVMSVVIDRLTGLIALLCLGLGGMAFMPAIRDQRMLLTVSVCLLVLCLFAVVMMLNVRWQTTLTHIVRGFPWGALRQRLNSVWSAFIAYRHHPQVMFVALLLSFAFQILLVVVNYCVAQSVGLKVPFLHFFWIVAIVSIVQMLPFTLAGLGLREGILVYLLRYEGVPASQAFAYSLVVFSIMVICGLTGGGIELLGCPRPVVHELPVVNHQHLTDSR